MCNKRKGYFKISSVVLWGILLVFTDGFAARSSVATTTGKAAISKPTQIISDQKAPGNLGIVRDQEQSLQQVKKSINFRKSGRAAMLKEMAKQAERDEVDPRSLQQIVAAPVTQIDRFTQTEAHLFLPSVRELIVENYKVGPYLNIISNAITNEAKHRNTHYAFYSTTSNMWRLAQDLDTRLFARFNPNIKSKDFTFLRFNNEYINSTAQGFLVNELKEKGLTNDNTDIKAIMLSVNFALLGNVGFPGECSWEYFVKPRGHMAPSRSTYETIISKYGLTDKYIDELVNLVDVYNTKEDTIMQIFIPKNKIDEIGYLAWTRGIPAHQETIDSVLRSAKTQTVKSALANLTEEFVRQKESNPLYKQMMQGIQAGDFSLDAFLKIYCNKPWDLIHINNAQGRLLFTPSVLGNPESGVIINRLSTVSSSRLKEYNNRLNGIIDKMIAEKEAAEDRELSSLRNR